MHGLDAQGNQDLFLGVSEVQLAFDLIASIGIRGVNQDHDAGGLDAVDDGIVPGIPGGDVARRDPAPDLIPFQNPAHGFRSQLVQG